MAQSYLTLGYITLGYLNPGYLNPGYNSGLLLKVILWPQG